MNDHYGFPIEFAEEPPSPETGRYSYGLDADEHGETMCEAAELEDGRWYLRVVRIEP